MKRTAAVILLFTLVFTASVTSFGQKSRSARIPVPTPGSAQFEAIRPFSDGQGVIIQWLMAYETRDIGFYVYRIAPDGPELVTPNIIGGYGTKSNAPTGYAGSYDYYDPNGDLNSQYFIQTLFKDGHRESTAAFGVKYTDNFERDTGHTKDYYEQHAQNHNGDLASLDMKLPQDLQNAHEASMLPPDLNTQRWVASQPGAKIAVRTEGMYRVTRTELQNAGFNVNSNSANWRLFMEGNEQAILIGAGDQYIEFYGRALNTIESNTRMYYLVVDPSTPGKRMSTRILRNQGGTVVSTSYTASTIKSQRFTFYGDIINGPDNNYFGQLLSSDPTPAIPFDLSSVDFGVANAHITIRLQGYLRNSTHNILARVNGHDVGFITGSSQDSMTATFTIPTSFLLEGANSLTFLTSSGADFAFFDTATVNYGRRYTADQNRVSFYTPGYRKAEVGNFNSANVRVFDTTYDANTQLLENFSVVNVGGTFTAKLPSDRAAMMYAVNDAGLLQSPSVTFNNPSTLSTAGNVADMIIISYSAADFMAASNSWANYRRSSAGGSFTVKVVDVADIYDEFGYGASSAASITGFLQYAKQSWQQPPPRYVLLVGDASYDPLNYEGFGNWNLVPTTIASLLFAETGSDEALADFDHDGRADFAVGRIPARAATDVAPALTKTMNFETPAGWNLESRGALFAFDMPIGFDFEAMSWSLRNELPAGTRIYWVPRGLPPPNQNVPDPNAHANLINGLNAGPYIANYAGHGSTGIWASSGYFSNVDVPNLVNFSNPTIYSMLTCLNGYFVNPSIDSISEALVKSPNGGAVAAWASATDTTPDLQGLMGVRFYDKLSDGSIPRLGDLVMDAKSVIAPGSDVGFSWVLIADPALKVHQ